MLVKRKVNVSLQTYNGWIHRHFIDPQTHKQVTYGVNWKDPNKNFRDAPRAPDAYQVACSMTATQLNGKGLL